MTDINASTHLARVVVQALIDAGVREVVLAPGSRNASLACAVFDADRAGLLRLHTRIDERSAAFLALGLTKAGSRAAVMCTSGTAVANLHPAMLEALHTKTPLVAVTADRPARLRGTTANQTTDQVKIFGRLIGTRDLDASMIDWALSPTPGGLDGPHLANELRTGLPIHWNVQFDDPLLPPSDEPWVPTAPTRVREATGASAAATGFSMFASNSTDLDAWLSRRTVVVAGFGGRGAADYAEEHGLPLLSEPGSGARFGENAIRTYRLLLTTELGEQVERAVVFGRPTLSRPVQRLLSSDGVEVWQLKGEGPWSKPPYPVDREFPSPLPYPLVAPDGWLDSWREADRSLGRQLDQLVAAEPGLTPHEVAAAASRAVTPGGLLAVGPSNPIRDLDLMDRPHARGQGRTMVVNRGLAGIDGMVSTAIGAALAKPDSTRSIALLGDVTFLHDSNGLVLGPEEERPDLTLVVVNDDGGSIFATLEQGAPEYGDRFERLFGTPHGVDLASLCAATRTPHLKVTGLGELEQALASPNGGIEVVEAVVGRVDRRSLDARIRALRP